MTTDRAAVLRAAPRHLRGHGPVEPRAALSALADEAREGPDVYGAGGALEAFEQQLADLFRKPAAVFFPSGTMAQLVALRVAADARACRTVAFHPTSHLELHEQRAYEHVHGLRARLVGPRHRPLLRADLDAVREPLAALLLELPQREIGGVCPPWDDVLATAAWARDRGVALHLDGARIWETTPRYGRPLHELVAPFDTAYVSFYKILGGVAGAALLGDADTIAHARIWKGRLGGNLVALYPYVLAARAGLRDRLPRVPSYVARAQAVARLLVAAGARVNPDPPHTNMMHAFFPADPERLLDACAEIATERGVALLHAATATEVPGWCRSEIVIGDAAEAIGDDELADLLRDLLTRAARPAARTSTSA